MSNPALNPNVGKRILLVEDDVNLAQLIGDFLSKNGFELTLLSNGVEALRVITDEQFHLVILDVMLPGMSGLDVCREVRSRYEGPLMMFTALGSDSDQMLGLELGADDYIVKPVQPRLLLSRINALFRRIKPSDALIDEQTILDPKLIKVGLLEINLSNRSVTIGDIPINLTSANFDLLNILARNPGTLIEREVIVQELRGFEYDGIDRSIDRRISRLRAKLQHHLQGVDIIKTIRGKGYQLCCDFDHRHLNENVHSIKLAKLSK